MFLHALWGVVFLLGLYTRGGLTVENVRNAESSGMSSVYTDLDYYYVICCRMLKLEGRRFLRLLNQEITASKLN